MWFLSNFFPPCLPFKYMGILEKGLLLASWITVFPDIYTTLYNCLHTKRCLSALSSWTLIDSSRVWIPMDALGNQSLLLTLLEINIVVVQLLIDVQPLWCWKQRYLSGDVWSALQSNYTVWHMRVDCVNAVSGWYSNHYFGCWFFFYYRAIQSKLK